MNVYKQQLAVVSGIAGDYPHFCLPLEVFLQCGSYVYNCSEWTV